MSITSKINPDGQYPGCLGLEIEVEGNDRVGNACKGWSVKGDGSLRGSHAAEYIVRTPCDLETMGKKVNALYDSVLTGNIEDSMRAGVHVHVDCSDMTWLELLTFCMAYFSLESCLTHRFGEEREGNLFCLRAKDADFIVQLLFSFVNRGVFDLASFSRFFMEDTVKYSAINLSALLKFSTLEFRAMKTPLTAQPVVDWMAILSSLKTNSKQYKSPSELIEAFSADGHDQVINNLLGDYAPEVLNQDDYQEKIETDMRQHQLWAFSIKGNN